MDPQQITLWGTLGGILVAALGGLVAQLVKRIDPELQQKIRDEERKAELETKKAEEAASAAAWQRVRDLLKDHTDRIESLEAELKRSQQQRDEDRKRISELETQLKDRDRQIAELTRQVQGKKKGLM